MDNAPIHTPVKVRELVESIGYKCLYLPPHSPFLNPIEEFWSKVKAGVRRNALTADEAFFEFARNFARARVHASVRLGRAIFLCS